MFKKIFSSKIFDGLKALIFVISYILKEVKNTIMKKPYDD